METLRRRFYNRVIDQQQKFETGEQMLQKLDWPVKDTYYSARLFVFFERITPDEEQ